MYQLFPVVRIVFLIVIFAFILFNPEPLAAQTTPALYYYYQGARVPLTLNPRLIAVRFHGDVSLEARRSTINAAGEVANFDARVESPIAGVVFVPLRAATNPLSAVARLRGRDGVLAVSPVYDFDAVQLAETDEFIVRFKASLSALDRAGINLANGATVARAQPFSDRVVILKLVRGSTRSARELANAYVEAGWAEFAEPNFVIRAAALRERAPQVAAMAPVIPNDTNFGLQWGLRNTRQFQGSLAGADINAINAWDVTQGASGLKIAIIDEGVSSSHPDLAGKISTGYNALDGTSNAAPKPNDHHGTAAAGIAAANTNNGLGLAGVCWFCEILPVKIAERDAAGNWQTTTGAIAAGIDWAWQNGADVLSNSWTMSAPSDDVQLSIINARYSGRGGKGSTLVFASGNANASTVAFPARLNSYVIAVGASNWCDQRKTPTNNACNNDDPAWGSNYGSALDLVAPGEAIYTTCNGNQCTSGQYTYFSGTSAAVPFVAGAAALLYSLNPNLPPDQLQSILQSGADDIASPGKDNETGHGRLDAYRAIASLYDLAVGVSANKPLAHPDETIAYQIAYSNPGATAMGATVISVTLPASTTYVSSTPAFSPQGGGVYQRALGTLASNAAGAAIFRLKPDQSRAGQTISFNVSISGALPELNTSNNVASATTVVIKQDYFLPFIRYKKKP